MIFLDANVFLRALVVEPGIEISSSAQLAIDLLNAIEAGTYQATTSELVIHEVCFVLHSKHHYGYTVSEIISLVLPLVQKQSISMSASERMTIVHALEIWGEHPWMGYADASIIARCTLNGWDIATLDRRLAALPSINNVLDS